MVPVIRTTWCATWRAGAEGSGCSRASKVVPREDVRLSSLWGREAFLVLKAGDGQRLEESVSTSLWDLYDRWWEEVADESRRLDQVLSAHRVHRLLDAAAGRGRLALALARRGYRVVACEADEGLWQQAARTLADASHAVPLYRVGLPGLSEAVSGPFDAVLALHDSLARWPPVEQLRALEACAHVLAPSGILVVGLRDWQAVLRDRSYFVPRRVARLNGSRLLMFDVRVFETGRVVWTTFYLLEQRGQWRVHTTSVTYYPITPSDLETVMSAAGFAVVERVEHPVENWWIALKKP